MKFTALSVAGLLCAGSSWGLSFSWLTPFSGEQSYRWTYSGRAYGGDPSRFNVGGAVFDTGINDDAGEDGFQHAGAGGTGAKVSDLVPGLGDFMAIFNSTLIELTSGPNAGDPLFMPGISGFQISGVLFGLVDAQFDTLTVPDGPDLDTAPDRAINLRSKGGRMEFYLNSLGSYSQTNALTKTSTALDTTMNYTGITAGTPFVAFNLFEKPNGFTDERTLNLSSPTATNATNRGSFFGAVDKTWSNYSLYGTMFDTNSQAFGTDVSFNYTMNLNSNAGGTDFNLFFNDPGLGALRSAAPVPEPSTLLLLGTGLLGMGMVRITRRKSC